MSDLSVVDKEKSNKAVVDSFYRNVFKDRDVDTGSKFIHKDYVNRNEFVPDGRNGFCEYFNKYFKTFPRTRAELELIDAKDNFVFVHAFHYAENFLFSVKFKVIDIYRLEEGMLVEHWDCIEGLNFFSKLMFTFKSLLRL